MPATSRELIKSLTNELNESTEQLDSLIFWMDDLLRLARELQIDLKRFYEPIKGWPPHIESLEGQTDYDTALENGKQILAKLKPTKEM